MSRKLLIFAHPDDEIIFGSSLVDSSDLIIICFSKTPDKIDINSGRNLFKKNPYKQNFVFLNIDESASLDYFLINNKDVDLNSNGFLYIKNHPQKEIYDSNSNLIFYKLKKLILPGDIIFTHNPWGEYGHIEHIQVFNCIMKLKKNINFKFEVFVDAYFGRRTYGFMRKTLHFLEPKPIKFKTNKLVYEKANEIYKKYNCWTWDVNYNLPRFEYFYKVINSDGFYLANLKNQNKFLFRQMIEFNHSKLAKLKFFVNFIDNNFPSFANLLIKLLFIFLNDF